MGKVSIGLRGWRFEESEIFTPDGEFRPLTEIPEDPRHRLVRLGILVDRPCDACYLIHGEAEKERCRPAAIVYGEPLDEVLLCDEHEADFLYWYREAGGREHRGEETFKDAFHGWFDDGGRAPEGYAGLEHVETDPEALPDPPDPEEIQARLEAQAAEEGFEGRRIDMRAELETYQARQGPPDGGEGAAADDGDGTDDADDGDGTDDADDGDGTDDADDDGSDGSDEAGPDAGSDAEDGDRDEDGDGDSVGFDDLDLGVDYPRR